MKRLETMLSVRNLQASYGPAQVLFDISFDIAAGEVVTLLGRNGMGKTTTILTIMGLVAARAGEVTFEGDTVTNQPPFRIAQHGIGLVPEGRQIFPALSVEENLIATSASRFGKPTWTLERVYEFFPRLKERRNNMGNQLSGGEQQMLAIGRALIGLPTLMLLDEPSLGLAPLIVKDIFVAIKEINREGTTILFVEQNSRIALSTANRGYVMQTGEIVITDTCERLMENAEIKKAYLGV